MINLPAGTRILLATRPVDFRKGAHGLAALAQEVLAEDPFSGTVIVYCSKRSDRLNKSGGAVLDADYPRNGSIFHAGPHADTRTASGPPYAPQDQGL